MLSYDSGNSCWPYAGVRSILVCVCCLHIEKTLPSLRSQQYLIMSELLTRIIPWSDVCLFFHCPENESGRVCFIDVWRRNFVNMNGVHESTACWFHDRATVKNIHEYFTWFSD